ncbi:metallophosphoesterase [Planctomycetaceae bacterium SH139]
MALFFWWLLTGFVILGHFALHLWIYNRINATGLPRRVIKVIKYFFELTCLIIPIAVAVWASPTLLSIYQGNVVASEIPVPLFLYGLLCLGYVIACGPNWLMSRPALNRDAFTTPSEVKLYDVQAASATPLAITTKCRVMSRLPMNQVFQLAVEEKQLPVIGLPNGLDGFKLAHFSDVHLTGHVSPQFYRYCLDHAVAWQPDMIALTGDVIDKHHCLDWLPACFSTAGAKHGCYFVLGNHDLRIADPGEVRRRMQAIGWTDLGGQRQDIQHGGVAIELMGNESPWFPPPELTLEQANDVSKYRLLLSHSPDQIDWARRHNVGLMLAGHTHGGQGRLPWIGPVLSPSYYGSRYASGTFFLPQTTMHVSRGLSGVHLMRINCPPELALITLRKA